VTPSSSSTAPCQRGLARHAAAIMQGWITNLHQACRPAYAGPPDHAFAQSKRLAEMCKTMMQNHIRWQHAQCSSTLLYITCASPTDGHVNNQAASRVDRHSTTSLLTLAALQQGCCLLWPIHMVSCCCYCMPPACFWSVVQCTTPPRHNRCRAA
jgi:hypothetical protein